MDNQESSSSSSGQQEVAKVEDKQVEKNMKEESKTEDQIQVEVEDRCFIEELPPEILEKILKCLDAKSLALSRLMNRRWNGMSREMIKSREDLVAVFFCNRTEDGNFRITGESPRASLENFMECFEDSKEAPLYTCFRFYCIRASVFGQADWIKFVSDFGKSVKCLKLVIHEHENVENMVRFAEKLRDLLLNQLPNLSEFGFYFAFSPVDGSSNPALSNIRLFPTTSTAQLPHLKTLYLVGDSFSKKTGIVTDLLCASVNLQRIESFHKWRSLDLFQTFQLLHSLGKLQCLQKAIIILTPELLSQVKEGSMDISLLKLKKLHLYVSADVYKNAAFQSDASVFLSSLFKSNKDSLTGLKMEPLGFLPRLQLPKFSKLTNLVISPTNYDQRIQVLPSGINLEEIFPVLQHLDLQVPWTDLFPHNEKVSCIPNLKTLIVTRQGLMGETITRISQVCPNLKEFRIGSIPYRGAIKNFPQVGKAIWTHLKQLESLDLIIDMSSPANAFPAVDSCLTGFSKSYSNFLYDLIKAEELFQMNIFEPQTELDTERKNPSILDLKDLKKLEITLLSCGTPEKMLSVSEKYGFQLMENLKYKIYKY